MTGPRCWLESDVVSLNWWVQLVVNNAIKVLVAIKHLNILALTNL